jgi:hypothetical protein
MKDIINPWVIGGSILTAGLLLVLTFVASGRYFPGQSGDYSGAAVITVIPIPTYTSTPPSTEPVLNPTKEPMTGIQVGGYVQITGTEGDGLRLRQDPSLSGPIVYLGLEGEIFQVTGGPQDNDGYLWWRLVAPLNEEKQGWAVSNYLTVAQSP